MRVKTEKPGGRHLGLRFPARMRLAGLTAGLTAAVLLAAGCSSASSSSSASASASASAASSTASAAASGQASSAGPAAPANDVGITATTIKVGMIADVNTAVAPGLFQKSVNAVKAWASIVNASGGLAGRKVVVDFCDSKLDPNATANCVINACQNDFALVGTSADALEDISDLDGCKNAAGKVKIWECNSGCYDPSFYQQGGSAVNGTYVSLLELPYLSDYKENPTLAKLITQLGGVNNFNNNALNSYVMALLFQDAVQKAVANGGTLTRASLFTALNDEHSFNADGIIGTTDVGKHTPSDCDVIAQLQNGVWQRVYPSKPGTFDCNSANLVQIKMNAS